MVAHPITRREFVRTTAASGAGLVLASMVPALAQNTPPNSRINIALIGFGEQGRVLLESLLKISLVLDCLVDFDKVCIDDGGGFARKSLDEILFRPKIRRKGRIK